MMIEVEQIDTYRCLLESIFTLRRLHRGQGHDHQPRRYSLDRIKDDLIDTVITPRAIVIFPREPRPQKAPTTLWKQSVR